MNWFRFYSEAIDDKKLRRIARETDSPFACVLGIWTIILSLASESCIRGALMIGDGVPATADDVSDIAGCNVTVTLQKLIVTGLVTDVDGVLRVSSWDKRQYTSDSSADRVRNHRNRQAAPQNSKKPPEVAESTPDVTPMKRYSNVTVTPPDTDTDTDTEKKDILAPSMLTDDLLFDELEKVHTTAVPFRRTFSNTKQRDKWHEVTELLGLEETQRCIDWCITHEKTTIGAIVNAAQTWHNNNAKTKVSTNGRNGHAIPAGLPAPELVWGTVQAEIDRVHYFGTPNLPQPIMAAVEAVGGWYAVCKCDPGGSIPARLRDAYRSAIGAG